MLERRRELVRLRRRLAKEESQQNSLSADVIVGSPMSHGVRRMSFGRGGALKGGGAGEAEDRIAAFKKQCVNVVREFFVSTDVGEVAALLAELAEGPGGKDGAALEDNLGAIFVKRCVSTSLDYSARELELVANLLSALVPGILSASAVARGFAELLEASGDLQLDIPETPQLLALFLARTVVDELLPPKVLVEDALRPRAEQSPLEQDIMAMARSLLAAKHGRERVLQAWGGGAAGTVVHFKRLMRESVAEMLSSGQVSEAERCFASLRAPFFAHELVKIALTAACEARSDEADALVADLLRALRRSGLATQKQLEQGFHRFSLTLEDLSLDVPDAVQRFDAVCRAVKSRLSGERER